MRDSRGNSVQEPSSAARRAACPACGASVLRTPHPKRGTWQYLDADGRFHFQTCAQPEAFKAHRRSDEHWCYQHPSDARLRLHETAAPAERHPAVAEAV